MPLTSALREIRIADTGGASEATLTDEQVSFGGLEDATDTVTVGDKTDQRVGARQRLAFTVYKNGDGANGFAHLGASQDLYAAMRAGTEKRVTFVFDGSANNGYRYDPVVPLVIPRFGTLDQEKAKILIHDAGSGAPPTGYDDLGAILGGSAPQFEIISANDGLGRPVYSRMKMTWTVDLLNEASATIDGHAGRLKVAVDDGGGTYFVLDDVKQFNLPVAGEEFTMTRLFLSAAWADPRGDSKIIWPAGAPTYLYGFEFQGVCAGSAKSDFFTIVTI